MKKLLMSIILATSLLSQNVSAIGNEIKKQIPVSQIEVLQGVISESNSAEYTCIDTIDGKGWAIYYDSDFEIGDQVVVVFDNMGTNDISDDEIIQVIKIQN